MKRSLICLLPAAFCLLFLAACQLNPTAPVLTPTQTLPPVDATPSPVRPTATLTPPSAPTNTPEAAAPTPAVTPTPDPNLGVGDVVYEDKMDFSSGWDWAFEDAAAMFSIAGEQLNAVMKQANVGPRFSVWDDLRVGDQQLRVTARANLCYERDEYGVMFRFTLTASSNYNGYIFKLNCGGAARVEFTRDEQITVLVDWTPSAAIVPGAPADVRDVRLRRQRRIGGRGHGGRWRRDDDGGNARAPGGVAEGQQASGANRGRNRGERCRRGRGERRGAVRVARDERLRLRLGLQVGEHKGSESSDQASIGRG